MAIRACRQTYFFWHVTFLPGNLPIVQVAKTEMKRHLTLVDIRKRENNLFRRTRFAHPAESRRSLRSRPCPSARSAPRNKAASPTCGRRQASGLPPTAVGERHD